MNRIWILKKDDFLRMVADGSDKKQLEPLKNVIEIRNYVICSVYPLHSDSHTSILRAEQILLRSLVIQSQRRSGRLPSSPSFVRSQELIGC